MRRRVFLTIPVAALSGPLLDLLRQEAIRLSPRRGRVRVPLRFFTAAEARVVEAACERILPQDATGPGASDAGVVVYIDRQLAGPYGRDANRYLSPPFVESVPEHGFQGRENPRQTYRAGIRGLGNFADQPREEQDSRLVAIEQSRFFRLLRAHTIEGMFSDPLHGGNADCAGWKLIGYPGPRMSNREEIDQHFGQAFRPEAAGLERITGRRVTPWEDQEQ